MMYLKRPYKLKTKKERIEEMDHVIREHLGWYAGLICTKVPPPCPPWWSMNLDALDTRKIDGL